MLIIKGKRIMKTESINRAWGSSGEVSTVAVSSSVQIVILIHEIESISV